jgi:hypothetical protein
MKRRFKRLLCAMLGHSWLVSDDARYNDGRGASVRFCSRCGRVEIQTHGSLGWDEAFITNIRNPDAPTGE